MTVSCLNPTEKCVRREESPPDCFSVHLTEKCVKREKSPPDCFLTTPDREMHEERGEPT